MYILLVSQFYFEFISVPYFEFSFEFISVPNFEFSFKYLLLSLDYYLKSLMTYCRNMLLNK